MNKRRVFALAFMLWAGLQTLACAADLPTLIAKAKPAVVTLDTKRSWLKGLISGNEDEKYNARGSGFVVSQDGLVVTAFHVVSAAKKVYVLSTTGQEFEATVLYTNPLKDLAVLKLVDVKVPLPYLELSTQLPREGEEVLAMGNPYLFPFASTRGIVSAVGVKTKGETGPGFVLTDASVNPGMSGGPLIDSHGQVLALLSQIYSTTGSFAGMTFALPAADVKLALESLR